jgi:TolA-binding protein
MRVARDLGDYSTVIEAADALLASSTLGSEDKNEATFSRALALDNTGKTAEARKLWKSIADNTDDLYGAKSAYYYSESLYNAKDYTNAQKSVETFINSGTPHSYWLARGFILLSDIYTAKGQSFEAREYLEALRENYPGKESDIFMMIDSRLNK